MSQRHNLPALHILLFITPLTCWHVVTDHHHHENQRKHMWYIISFLERNASRGKVPMFYVACEAFLVLEILQRLHLPFASHPEITYIVSHLVPPSWTRPFRMTSPGLELE